LPDNSEASGDGNWFNFLAGLAFQNPTQPASPLDGEREQADMRALDARLSSSGNIKDAVALYNARKSKRQKSAYDQV